MHYEQIALNGNPKTTLTLYLTENYGYRPQKPLVIVCPGGGFLDCSPNEGEPVAMNFLRAGCQAAVLLYSNAATAPGVPALPQAMFDLAAAVCLVRQNAAAWNVDPAKIAVLGFSAGAQMCALYGNRWQETMLDGCGAPKLRRPNAVLLGYAPLEHMPGADAGSDIDMQAVLGGEARAVQMQEFLAAVDRALYGHTFPTEKEKRETVPIGYISAQTPPTYIWHTFGDEIVSPLQSLHYAEALYKAGIPCELHVFDKGGHGLSLADRSCAKKSKGIDPHVAHWAELAVEWLDRQLS